MAEFNHLSDQQLRDLLIEAERDSWEEAPEIRRIIEERRMATEKAAEDSFEAKIGRGPAATQTVPKEVHDRLRRLGVPPGKMKDTVDAYSNMKDALARNPHLTEKELREDIASRGYHADHIAKMESAFKTVEPLVKADLGQSNVDTDFPDEASRRNYLIANHFTDAEIAKTLSHWTPQNNEYQKKARIFPIPDVAKDRIAEQQVKHAEARVKRSNAQQEEAQRIGVVQNYDAQTMPGTAPEKHAMELGAAGSDILAHQYGRGYQKYKGDRFAKKTPEEEEAERLTKELNPNTAAEAERQRILKEVTSRNLGKDASQKAAAPYMSKASADFAKRHNEMFGDIETKNEQSLIDKMNENYLEKIAPSIHQKYMTQGVKSHGHVAKEQAQLLKQAQEGTARAITETRAQNRAASMGATLGEQANQGNLARQAGALSQADADADRRTTETLEEIHARHEKEKLLHATRVGAIGEANKDTEQHKINDARQEFRNEENHATKYAEKMIDAANANPISGLPQEQEIPSAKQTGRASTAAGFMGMGASMLGGMFGGAKEKKAGGRIHRATGGPITPVAHSKYVTPHAMIGYLQAKSSHQRLAAGGQVDPNLIQDAVFAGELPSTALRQKIRQDVLGQAKEDYDAKSRNHLAVGGTVDMFANAKKAPTATNPIAQGASMAEDFVESNRDREIKDKVHAERMKILNPKAEPEESMFSRGIKGFMAGAANSGNDDWVARSGKAFTGAISADDTAREAKRKREKERQKLILDVGKQFDNEINAKKKMSLSEKAHALSLRKQAEDELTGQSTRGYNDAKTKLALDELGEYVRPDTAKEKSVGDPSLDPDLSLDDNTLSRPEIRLKPNDRNNAITKYTTLDAELDKGQQAALEMYDMSKSTNTGAQHTYETLQPITAILSGHMPGTLGRFKTIGQNFVNAQNEVNRLTGVGDARLSDKAREAQEREKPAPSKDEETNIGAATKGFNQFRAHRVNNIRNLKRVGAPKSAIAKSELALKNFDADWADKQPKAEKSTSHNDTSATSGVNPGKKAAAKNDIKEAARKKLASKGIYE